MANRDLSLEEVVSEGKGVVTQYVVVCSLRCRPDALWCRAAFASETTLRISVHVQCVYLPKACTHKRTQACAHVLTSACAECSCFAV